MSKTSVYQLATLITLVLTFLIYIPMFAYMTRTQATINSEGGFSGILYVTFLPIIAVAGVSGFFLYKLYRQTFEALNLLVVVWPLHALLLLLSVNIFATRYNSVSLTLSCIVGAVVLGVLGYVFARTSRDVRGGHS